MQLRKEPYLACKRLLGMWMGFGTLKVTGFAVAAIWDVIYWIYGVSLSQNPLVGLLDSSVICILVFPRHFWVSHLLVPVAYSQSPPERVSRSVQRSTHPACPALDPLAVFYPNWLCLVVSVLPCAGASVLFVLSLSAPRLPYPAG